MQNLLNNKLVMGIIIAVVLALIGFGIFYATRGKVNVPTGDEKINKPIPILETEETGKALEIQALLARQGIEVSRTQAGPKNVITLEKGATKSQRDIAYIAIVQSGLMDKNIGLEIFDKGDFTSSKEDKRIRLSRAINGELSRLIKRMPPIIDASVFVSIPEPTIFTAFQKPLTATVQVTLPLGSKLERDKERAIINLLIGSVQGLDIKHIALTDTNGNVYNSLIDPGDDMMTLLDENDQYMKNKIMVQLDKLVGAGKYVVTVSTFLRQVPLKTDKLIYNPDGSLVSSKQTFKEKLGDKESEKKIMSGAVSSFIPGGLPGGPQASSNRDYDRSAEETQFGLGKTQISETKSPGILEEVSIAITLDEGSLPQSMTEEDFKSLIARAASPKVDPKNVKIAFSKPLAVKVASDASFEVPKAEESGNPWYAIAFILGGGLILGLLFIWNRVTSSTRKQHKQIQQLQEIASNQEQQLKAAQNQAAQMYQNQELLTQSLQTIKTTPSISARDISSTLADLRDTLEESTDDSEVAYQLKNWIEAGN